MGGLCCAPRPSGEQLAKIKDVEILFNVPRTTRRKTGSDSGTIFGVLYYARQENHTIHLGE
jgi:hypothetical protein